MAELYSLLPEGLLVNRTFFAQHDVGPTAVDYYLRSGKIEQVAHGLYRKPGPPLKWENVVYSLNLLGYDVHVGHITAIGHHGYEHYLRLGSARPIRVYSTQKLPSWVEKLDVGPGFLVQKRNPFTDDSIGIIDVPFGTWDWPIPYSTAERAFIEFASTIQNAIGMHQLKVMLEGAIVLRAVLFQELLEACRSIKAKRIFLYLARTIHHPWYAHLDVSRIDIGSGKRQIVSGGILDEEFLITVPAEFSDEQEELVW